MILFLALAYFCNIYSHTIKTRVTRTQKTRVTSIQETRVTSTQEIGVLTRWSIRFIVVNV
jgi:hypothetical protein